MCPDWYASWFDSGEGWARDLMAVVFGKIVRWSSRLALVLLLPWSWFRQIPGTLYPSTIQALSPVWDNAALL